MTGRLVLDVEKLYVALDKVRREKHLLWRDIARDAGVSTSTFTRMGLYHQKPNADGLIRILGWLGAYDISPFVGRAPAPERAAVVRGTVTRHRPVGNRRARTSHHFDRYDTEEI